LEIVGYRSSNGDLCLDFVYEGALGDREASGCGSPSIHTHGVSSGPDRIAVTGATTKDVATIRVHYRRAGRPGVAPATLARATHPRCAGPAGHLRALHRIPREAARAAHVS